MRKLFFSDSSCKETKVHTVNPQSWLKVERGKLAKFNAYSPSSIESLIKVSEPPILPLFKPVDYVKVLAHVHEELETCSPDERSNLHLIQYQVFKGLGEAKLSQRSLRSAWEKASTIHEKLIFGAWLKYEKQGEEPICDLLSSCIKCSQEFQLLEFVSQISFKAVERKNSCNSNGPENSSLVVYFRIREEKIACDRQKIAALSTPLHTMLNGDSWSLSLK
uniref:Uncharacterized protein n=1 Tax=Ananas comosus var. bracteatus TaxID=296719 RepID=A0A6V7QYE5_ANACO